MGDRPDPVRHVVAWLPAVRWTTCLALWTAVATVRLFPQLNLSLRAIAPIGLAAAVCRTLVAALAQRREKVPPFVLGLSLCADAALLTGLLDITGGPFNPFIAMFVTYVWLAAVTLSLPWAAVVGMVSAAGFGWLVLDHVQAEIAEHHRLNDFPAHLFTMWVSGAAVAELVRVRLSGDRQLRLRGDVAPRVLTDCGGNLSRAARALRIHRRSLQRKLAKYPSST